jgi:K+ potassium transporter
MAKKRAYELDRRVRLRELLRRDGEVSLSKESEGAFILGDGNRFVREKVGVMECAAPSEQLGSTTTSDDSIAIISAPLSDSPISGLQGPQLFLYATDKPVARLPGISIYYTSAPMSHSYAPCTFRQFLEHFPALHSTCIFLHVRTAAQPHVADSEKLVLETSPMWDGIWHGVYRVGYMETPDFVTENFTLSMFQKLGRPVEPLTHVLQRTALMGRKPKETKGIWSWIKKIPARIRGWSIDVVWNGVDEAIGGVGKGWNVPVQDVVSVGAVAEV